MSYVTNTSYGSWYTNTKNELNVATAVGTAIGDYGDDYDLDAIVSDYKDAIDEALPDRVSLSGDEFLGPYYEADQNFDGYPLNEDDQLDIGAIVEGVDLWEIVARHEVWTVDQVAEELGYSGANANATARKTLSRWGVKATDHKANSESGRVQARYLAREVKAAKKDRPRPKRSNQADQA